MCLCSAWRGGRPPLHQPPTALQPPHKRAVRAILSGARTCLLSSLTAPGSLTRFAPIFRSLEYLFGGVAALAALAAVHKRLPRSAKKVDIGEEGGAAVARRFDGSATMRAARKASAFKRTYVADARIDYSHRMNIWMRGPMQLRANRDNNNTGQLAGRVCHACARHAPRTINGRPSWRWVPGGRPRNGLISRMLSSYL